MGIFKTWYQSMLQNYFGVWSTANTGAHVAHNNKLYIWTLRSNYKYFAHSNNVKLFTQVPNSNISLIVFYSRVMKGNYGLLDGMTSCD